VVRNASISQFNSSSGNGIYVVSKDTNLGSLTVDRSTFSDSPNGNDGILAEARGTSNMTIDVTNGSRFTGLFGDGVQFNSITGASGTLNVSVVNSIFEDAAFLGNNGISINPFGGPANLTMKVQGNLLENIGRPFSNLGMINMTIGDLDGGGPSASVNVTGNVLRDISGTRGIAMIADTFANSMDLVVDNNTIDCLATGTSGKGAITGGPRDNANADVWITNNDIGQSSGSCNATIDGPPARTIGVPGSEVVSLGAQGAASLRLLANGNAITGDTAFEILRSRGIGTSTTGFTAKNNLLTNLGAGDELNAAANLAGNTATVNTDFTGNTVGSGSGTIRYSQNASNTINSAQASAAAVASANGLPGANVVVSGSTNFGQPAPATPAGRAAQVVQLYPSSVQSANTNSAFATPLTVAVTDSNGNPISGATVTFTAPGSGASGSFTGGSTATTNAQGIATKAFTANGTSGAYQVTAATPSAPGSAAVFSLRNN
jgi:hypothetical protein